MKKLRNQTVATIVLFLILAVSSPLLLFAPIAKAGTYLTHAYLSVSPDPAGVNQDVTILMWLAELNPIAAGLENHWDNYTLQITKPDGQTQNFGPFYSDAASYVYYSYKPDQTGTYTLKFTFPGQQVTGNHVIFRTPIDDYYEGSSYTTTLTVQQEKATPTPQPPIPTEYWTRPINAQNQEWYKISGNWLGIGDFYGFGAKSYNGTGNYNPYTTAPHTAHIVWTKPLRYGGLIGGEFGNTPVSNYYTGKTYETTFVPPIIINGVLYYTMRHPPKQGFYAVDLRTGEELWWQNTTSQEQITMGQVYNYLTPNQIGGFPYLWSTDTSTWVMYDAVTGGEILRMANATARRQGTNNVIQGPNGEILMYLVGTSWIAMWNSSLCIGNLGPTGTNAWQWRPIIGSTLNWKRGIQWNVTTPAYPGQNIFGIGSGVIVTTTGNQMVTSGFQMEMGYNASTGQQLWEQNRTVPIHDLTLGWWGPIASGVYTEYHRTTQQWYGYSLYTGERVWGPTESGTNPWGTIVIYESQSADGVLYALTVDGLHAFNMKTGTKLWDFYGDNSGTDFPGFNTYPFEQWGAPPTIADGLIFAGTGNTHCGALYRGARLYAVDTTTGNKVWHINGFYLSTMPIADGYLVAHNGYDNQIYTFGKGQSATTVSASPKVSVHGEGILIEGTITDQSPGETCLGIPAAGTPAVADEYMTEWMEYLYMQQECPEYYEGVDVKLEVLDPNGNFYEIGTVKSDGSGMFKKMWTPEHEGEYTIIATFEGSDSYFSSYAETAIGVGPAPEPSGPIEPEPTEPSEAPLITTELAIIVAAVIVAVAVIVGFWIIRKRK